VSLCIIVSFNTIIYSMDTLGRYNHVIGMIIAWCIFSIIVIIVIGIILYYLLRVTYTYYIKQDKKNECMFDIADNIDNKRFIEQQYGLQQIYGEHIGKGRVKVGQRPQSQQHPQSPTPAMSNMALAGNIPPLSPSPSQHPQGGRLSPETIKVLALNKYQVNLYDPNSQQLFIEDNPLLHLTDDHQQHNHNRNRSKKASKSLLKKQLPPIKSSNGIERLNTLLKAGKFPRLSAYPEQLHNNTSNLGDGMLLPQEIEIPGNAAAMMLSSNQQQQASSLSWGMSYVFGGMESLNNLKPVEGEPLPYSESRVNGMPIPAESYSYEQEEGKEGVHDGVEHGHHDIKQAMEQAERDEIARQARIQLGINDLDPFDRIIDYLATPHRPLPLTSDDPASLSQVPFPLPANVSGIATPTPTNRYDRHNKAMSLAANKITRNVANAVAADKQDNRERDSQHHQHHRNTTNSRNTAAFPSLLGRPIGLQSEQHHLTSRSLLRQRRRYHEEYGLQEDDDEYDGGYEILQYATQPTATAAAASSSPMGAKMHVGDLQDTDRSPQYKTSKRPHSAHPDQRSQHRSAGSGLGHVGQRPMSASSAMVGNTKTKRDVNIANTPSPKKSHRNRNHPSSSPKMIIPDATMLSSKEYYEHRLKYRQRRRDIHSNIDCEEHELYYEGPGQMNRKVRIDDVGNNVIDRSNSPSNKRISKYPTLRELLMIKPDEDMNGMMFANLFDRQEREIQGTDDVNVSPSKKPIPAGKYLEEDEEDLGPGRILLLAEQDEKRMKLQGKIAQSSHYYPMYVKK
jgi:uncharacterized membrane protein